MGLQTPTVRPDTMCPTRLVSALTVSSRLRPWSTVSRLFSLSRRSKLPKHTAALTYQIRSVLRKTFHTKFQTAMHASPLEHTDSEGGKLFTNEKNTRDPHGLVRRKNFVHNPTQRSP